MEFKFETHCILFNHSDKNILQKLLYDYITTDCKNTENTIFMHDTGTF